MKFTMNVECSPEEARSFFGLPDVQPMQERLMQELESRLQTNMRAMDPEVMARTWFPTGIQNFEQMQKMFWGQMQQGFSGFHAPIRTEEKE
jgi:tetrahydromethanopterin S-methyltransferase subunit B